MALPAIMLAASMAGMLMQAQAQKQSAEAQRKSAYYNAALAEQDAEVADAQALDIMRSLAVDTENYRREWSQQQGQNTANFAANGLDINTGTPRMMLEQAEADAEYNINTLRNNAAKQEWEYNRQATAKRSEASMLRASGDNAYSTGRLMVGASLLSGLSSWGNQYWNMNQVSGKKTGSTASSGGTIKFNSTSAWGYDT